MNRFGDIDCSLKQLPPIYGYHSEQVVSIEKSLEPIENEIEELIRYIKIAEKHCRFPSPHGLSKDESAALYIYTMEWGENTLYRVLNKALRSENRQSLKIWFPYLKLFKNALDKLPKIKEVIWRGVPLNIGKQFSENQVVTWWSINSCSSSVNVIKNFLGDTSKSTLFLIEAINGKSVSDYTEYQNENEIILTMGTQFRVKCDPLEQSNGSHIVHLIEIDDNDSQLLESTRNKIQIIANPSNRCTLGQSTFRIPINTNTKWKENGIIIAGGKGKGNRLSQLYQPCSVYVDDDHQCIYISDWGNHRILQWKLNEKSGQVVAGGNKPGDRSDQLDCALDVIVDKRNNSLIIADYGNRRVVRWPRQNGRTGETIISNIACSQLAMDYKGNLYTSDSEKHEVRRWKIGDNNGTTVAGGNGQGNELNQLDNPSFIFVDEDCSVYVSDWGNDRVMKWMNGAKVGIVVAGGQGEGDTLTQVCRPKGLIVDHLDNVYVADSTNCRIMCWSKGSKEGRIIVGGNGQGNKSNQLDYPQGLSFDRQGNLYITEWNNHRIQKFNVNSN